MNIEPYWYRDKVHPALLPLLPFALAFKSVAGLRRLLYRLGLKKTHRFSLPLIVVGNITVGGTGKTPFVLWLVNYLKEQGKNPGIALRGVGGNRKREPVSVTPSSDPYDVGDEAVLLAKNTASPVVACIDRVAAVERLIELGCDIVVCDDGLQHYRLGRTVEIAIIDGDRYFGNGLPLPAGPLREPVSRLKKVDFILLNQHQALPLPDSHNRVNQLVTSPMRLQMDSFVSVHSPAQKRDLAAFAHKKVHAVAGIGNPRRFFEMLRSLDIDIIPHAFPDHHLYEARDLDFGDRLDILMTEKDAIKCRKLGIQDRWWYLRVNTEVSLGFKKALMTKINNIRSAHETIIT